MTRIIVNGTFDIIHIGHLRLLSYAKSLGDHLLVCIDTDRRVRELKGNSRPINNEFERRTLLEHLRCVDEVKLFDNDDDLICYIKQSDIMVKGSDYIGKPIIGSEYCKDIVYYERIEEYSSTKKIQDIATRR